MLNAKSPVFKRIVAKRPHHVGLGSDSGRLLASHQLGEEQDANHSTADDSEQRHDAGHCHQCAGGHQYLAGALGPCRVLVPQLGGVVRPRRTCS